MCLQFSRYADDIPAGDETLCPSRLTIDTFTLLPYVIDRNVVMKENSYFKVLGGWDSYEGIMYERGQHASMKVFLKRVELIIVSSC